MLMLVCLGIIELGEFLIFQRNIFLSLSLLPSTFCPSLSSKALFVFMALSFARDEIIWLLRHADNIQKKNTDDFIDKYGHSCWNVQLHLHMISQV